MSIKGKQIKTNSKRLGNAFERRVCKLLSMAVSRNSRDDLFWRTPSSGAIGWRSRKYDGDIMLTDDTGAYKCEWIIECKTTRKGSVIPLRSSVKEYLRQCEARYGDRRWILILQIRGQDDLFVITKENIGNTPTATLQYADKKYFVYDFFLLDFSFLCLT